MPLPRSQKCPLVFSSENLMVSFTCISVIHLEPFLVCAMTWGFRCTFESIWRTNCLSIVYGKHHLFYCILDHDSNFDLWAPFCTITHLALPCTNAAWLQDLRISFQRNYRFPALALPLKELFISMCSLEFIIFINIISHLKINFWKINIFVFLRSPNSSS